ncbi:MAG: DoxX family protein [Acidimicrobiales bacterium]
MTDTSPDATTRPTDAPHVRRHSRRLAASMLTMGVAHLVAPEPTHQVIPASVGSPRRWSRVVAGVEATAGVLLLIDDPRARRTGAWLALGAFTSATVAAARQAIEAGTPDSPKAVQAWVRLPLQLPALVSTYRLARA